jgi:hypothetical protein
VGRKKIWRLRRLPKAPTKKRRLGQPGEKRNQKADAKKAIAIGVILGEEDGMKQKPAILRGPYPTVEDTARLLGVSDRRLKELLHLVGSKETSKVERKRSTLSERKLSEAKRKRAATKKRMASGSRKRRNRVKTAEAHA